MATYEKTPMSTYDRVMRSFHQNKKPSDTELPSYELRRMAKAICKEFDARINELEKATGQTVASSGLGG